MAKEPTDSSTRYFATKDQFTAEDLEAIWPGEQGLPPQVAQAFLRTSRRIGPGQIFLPKFSKDKPEEDSCLIWVVKGRLLLGGMRGEPLGFFPVIECSVDLLFPVNSEFQFEIRGGENGAIILVLSRSLVSRVMKSDSFFKKFLIGFDRLLQGVIEQAKNKSTGLGEETGKAIADLAAQIYHLVNPVPRAGSKTE